MNPDQDPRHDEDRPSGAAGCPVCLAPVLDGDTYCEACGHALGSPVCTSCGAAAVDAEGYCERCGLRQPTGRDHAETVLDGGAAAVTDRGLRRSRNEDAMALLAAGDTIVTVVCDGVGSSPRADEASAAAVEAAGAALARGLPHREAFGLAGRAVSKLATSVDDAPACTYVAAVAEPGRVRLAWAGDTRAYWLPRPRPGEKAQGVLLTEDDAVETGEITAWLGADAEDVEPHVRTLAPEEPGTLLVCSDGLWRYLDGYAFPGTGTPLELARELLRQALHSGGQDNVTIVVIPLGDSHE
ncbi:PP2C family serine/threonine-protein phosphatase [Nonomuraea jiangxiensis]|uniref:Serine/threonine protein phosphatase PrpC n=1 Tax=Nonomuraea jiangxiensis TaxID=633440 RepID=A0A1G7YX21_9ACTN|nr:protein phosphatase 2C domain-containing protein [Nonomuraea jiangxiensis]SDH00895.1 Serine/threonine protein phosphatase PrpC [Nonomuraea jiangxiensis]